MSPGAAGDGPRIPVVELDTRPLTAARFRDLEAVFGARGCGVARSCWCMYYRRSGRVSVPPGHGAAARNRAALRARVDAGEFTGLVGYEGRTPVGWIAFGPRTSFPKLARSPVMKPVDDAPVWSIVCLVVPGPQRGRGIARALLHGAIEFARRRRVAVLEAYPVDRTGRSDDQSMWFGAKSTYDAIVRLRLR
jgi:GNAT superfamily N-acetyltransferase